jgi:hypothetical protein
MKSFNRQVDPKDVYFSSQEFCFIDDLVIEANGNKRNWYYQLKDIQKLDWSDGKSYPMKDDFRHQHAICSRAGIEAFLRLVVSEREVCDHLESTVPADLTGLVKVLNFESAASLNSLIRSNSLFRRELTEMCALKNPSQDKLEALATIVLGAWDSTSKKKVSLSELLDKCFIQNPHYIKGFYNKISAKLEEIFSRIEGLLWEVEGGFIKWRFGRKDEGVISYRIGSAEFEQWENDLFNATIVTFEDLEPFLV